MKILQRQRQLLLLIFWVGFGPLSSNLATCDLDLGRFKFPATTINRLGKNSLSTKQTVGVELLDRSACLN